MSELELVTQRTVDLRPEEGRYLLKILKRPSGSQRFTVSMESGTLTLWVPGFGEVLSPARASLVADVLGPFEQSLVPDRHRTD